jgi:hypothetical protein
VPSLINVFPKTTTTTKQNVDPAVHFVYSWVKISLSSKKWYDSISMIYYLSMSEKDYRVAKSRRNLIIWYYGYFRWKQRNGVGGICIPQSSLLFHFAVAFIQISYCYFIKYTWHSLVFRCQIEFHAANWAAPEWLLSKFRCEWTPVHVRKFVYWDVPYLKLNFQLFQFFKWVGGPLHMKVMSSGSRV